VVSGGVPEVINGHILGSDLQLFDVELDLGDVGLIGEVNVVILLLDQVVEAVKQYRAVILNADSV